MSLSREETKVIDKHLEKKGVKYWDIRLELLDHVVTDIECRIEKGESKESAKQSVFYSMGLDDSLEGLTRNRLQAINKIVKQQYFRKLKELLTKLKYIFPILILFAVYFLTYSYSSILVFKSLTLSLLLTPIVLGVLSYIYEYARSRKSGYLIYTSFYIFFSFLILNMFIQFLNPEGIIPVSKETQLLVWFLVTCVNTIFSLAGILVHVKKSREMKTIKNKLLSL